MRVLPWAGIVATIWALVPGPRAAADEKLDVNALYEKGVKSRVFLVAPQREGRFEGSGSLIDAKRRLVLTNAHIVGNADSVFVQFPERDKDGSLVTEKR
jgi:S1-C subfamily serine protease